MPSPSPHLYVEIQNGGDYGLITAATIPGATCSAKALLPNGEYAPGIRNPQTAAADGSVYWNYPHTPTDDGTGLHTVTCTLHGLSGTDSMSFDVGA